jgi:neutral ceramidase
MMLCRVGAILGGLSRLGARVAWGAPRPWRPQEPGSLRPSTHPSPPPRGPFFFPSYQGGIQGGPGRSGGFRTVKNPLQLPLTKGERTIERARPGILSDFPPYEGGAQGGAGRSGAFRTARNPLQLPLGKGERKREFYRVAAAWLFAGLLGTLASPALAGELKVGAAAKPLEATDAMVIGGGIGPGHLEGQEGELRASAVVVEGPDGGKACLVACDVLMIERDVLDDAARKIAERTGIPFDRILINATHTHHAPTTATIHGYEREEAFTRQVGDKAVAAAVEAHSRLRPASLRFRLGEESSVGKNSRLLLKDGTIFWVGTRDDALRPTGPFDPELPVLAFARPEGGLEAVMFNHSTHTIGTVKGAVRSPSFYGLAAQELEKERGGTFLFFEGASGSSHNLDLTAAESAVRIKAAVADALGRAREHPVDRVIGKRREVSLKVRHFDEAADDAAVVAYCTKRQPAPYHEKTIGIFRDMRKKLAPRQGEERKTWVQAIVLGDIALVGVPGEFFTVLGQDIKRRSPYRYTYVFELANDYVGYIPDARGYELGGYQTWTGLHSFLEKGSGETIVDAAVEVLQELHEAKAAR